MCLERAVPVGLLFFRSGKSLLSVSGELYDQTSLGNSELALLVFCPFKVFNLMAGKR